MIRVVGHSSGIEIVTRGDTPSHTEQSTIMEFPRVQIDLFRHLYASSGRLDPPTTDLYMQLEDSRLRQRHQCLWDMINHSKCVHVIV